ncbi:MAG TPA: hypothetical protein VFX98_04635 [Longimicrobiaceae bacterium]|nr:hypothetical protein [Longimicrobiaceae bacterium]
MRRTPLAAALCLAAAAAPAAAQDISLLTGLFENVENISLFIQTGGVFDRGRISSSDPFCCLVGAGGEVLINLRSTPGGLDYELGLGTSFLRGFESQVEGLDFRGSVRSFPSISLYVSGQRLPGTDLVRGYVGGTFGFVELWNARAFDPDGTRHPATGQTLELGASLGVYLDRGPLSGLIAEAAYRHRHFPSVDWGADDAVVPEEWPRALDLSGLVFAFGYQFPVKSDDEDEESSGVAGMWIGEGMDGQAFPVLLESSSTGQMELVGATLMLSTAEAGEGEGPERGSYELVLLRRRTVRGQTGAISVTSPPAEPERGEYVVEDGGARLLRPGGEAHGVLFDQGKLYLRLAGTSHLLVFRLTKP